MPLFFHCASCKSLHAAEQALRHCPHPRGPLDDSKADEAEVKDLYSASERRLIQTTVDEHLETGFKHTALLQNFPWR